MPRHRLRTSIDELRCRVNALPDDSLFRSNRQVHRKVCAALDAIEDANEAFSEYRALPDGPVGYLAIYGLLQVLFVQQDAVATIYSCLGPVAWNPTGDTKLKNIRTTRNMATGHPTDHAWGEPRGSFFLSRPHLTKEEVLIIGILDDESEQFSPRAIEPLRMIRDQESSLSRELNRLLDHLDGDRSHVPVTDANGADCDV